MSYIAGVKEMGYPHFVVCNCCFLVSKDGLNWYKMGRDWAIDKTVRFIGTAEEVRKQANKEKKVKTVKIEFEGKSVNINPHNFRNILHAAAGNAGKETCGWIVSIQNMLQSRRRQRQKLIDSLINVIDVDPETWTELLKAAEENR